MFDDIETWLATQGVTLLGTVLKAVVIAVVGILIIRTVQKVVTKALEKSKLEKAGHNMVKALTRTVMYILLALIIASSLGIDVTGIVALASVATLAVSLALQDLLGNLVGGFTLLYTHPFSAGDYVEIAGQGGTVKEVGMTYTKLITPDNKVISIPNSAVVSAQITNYTVGGARRVDINISASYDAPVQKVIDTLVGCADGSYVLTDMEKPYAVLLSYGDSAINYQLRFWVDGNDYWTATFEVNQKLKAVFEANGIEMTYPHLNVHLDK